MSNVRKFNVYVDGERFEVSVEEIGGSPTIKQVEPVSPATTAEAPSPPSSATAPTVTAPAAEGTPLIAPMPGTIINFEKNEGDSVEEGETVVILEAMKMENALPAPASGIVKAINFKSGDSVARGDILCVIG